jgi:hypothetical protein
VVSSFLVAANWEAEIKAAVIVTDMNIESNTIFVLVLVAITTRKRRHQPENRKTVTLWNFPKLENSENSSSAPSYIYISIRVEVDCSVHIL